MRKGQLYALLDAVRRGRILWLLRQAAKIPLCHLSSRYLQGRSLGGPFMATIVPTSRCNLDCVFCGIANRKAEQRSMSAGQLHGVVRQLLEMGVAGIGFSGGEPLLHSGTIPAIKYARHHGVVVSLATNAYALSQGQIEELVAADPNIVTISLDSVHRAVHDKLRNRPGAHDRTLAAIKELKARISASCDSATRIHVVGVICGDNALELPQMIEQAKTAGADAVGFIAEHSIVDGNFVVVRNEQVDGLSARIIAHSSGYAENSLWYLKHLEPVIRAGSGPPKPCGMGYSSLTVGPEGSLYGCWPHFLANRSFSGVDLDQPDGIKRAWNGAAYRRRRHELLACHSCFVNCTAELNHTLRFW